MSHNTQCDELPLIIFQEITHIIARRNDLGLCGVIIAFLLVESLRLLGIDITHHPFPHGLANCFSDWKEGLLQSDDGQVGHQQGASSISQILSGHAHNVRQSFTMPLVKLREAIDLHGIDRLPYQYHSEIAYVDRVISRMQEQYEDNEIVDMAPEFPNMQPYQISLKDIKRKSV